MSGESGRTRPSLGEMLGQSCTCVELDVVGILPPEADADPVPASAGEDDAA